MEESEEPFAPGVSTANIECHDSDEKLVESLSLSNDTVYIGRKLVTDIRVPGRVNKEEFRDFWVNELQPSQLLLDIILNGYKLQFKNGIEPPESYSRNNKSAREDMDFVRAEILRLEALGCVRRVKKRPHIVLPLSSIFSKKKRVVMDSSRGLNPFLEHLRVRL